MQSTEGDLLGKLEARNIGGISRTECELRGGVTVLAGENATNRTSLLRALSAVLGSTDVSLKGDTDEGRVELTIEGETYYRELTRQNGTVKFSGKPYLTDEATYAELFAFLFEDNEARRAIRSQENLYDIVMKPVDTEEIEREINRLKQQRDQKQQRKTDLEAKQEELPDLKERRNELQEEIGELEAEIEAKKDEIEQADTSIEDSHEDTNQVDSKIQTLREKQSSLEDVQTRIERTTQTINSLEEELEENQDELADLSVDENRLADLEEQISQLYDDISRKESMMNRLQNIMQFNEEMIEENTSDEAIFAALREGQEPTRPSSDVTDKLLEEDSEIICWTCGSKTEKTRMSEMIKRLRSVHEDLFGEKQQLSERIDDLESKKAEIERRRDRRESLETANSNITEKLGRRRSTLEQLENRKETLTEEIATLEDEIQELQEKQDSRITTLHQEVSKLEYELSEKKDELAELTTQIEDIESSVDDIQNLEDNIEKLNNQLETVRGKINEIERQTIEQFNDRMDELLDVLAYDNIERVWIERKETTTKEGRRNVTKTQFDLHVIRNTEDGVAYEDTVEHLSESEREVTGLVFALAGYLAHELHETVPWMILDSLEAIDSQRIARLLDYFEEFVPNITVALLDEDATALPAEYSRVETY